MKIQTSDTPARFPARKLSDCIEEAIAAFERQLYDYWVMQAELGIRLDQVAASSKAKSTDFMAINTLLLQTMGATNQIVAALRTLVGLARFVG
jgi:hypothetical protein